MTHPVDETAPKLPPGQQEMVPRAGLDNNYPPASKMMPPANFSEAIDRIGLGPFQTRLMIMCGMVSRMTAVAANS